MCLYMCLLISVLSVFLCVLSVWVLFCFCSRLCFPSCTYVFVCLCKFFPLPIFVCWFILCFLFILCFVFVCVNFYIFVVVCECRCLFVWLYILVCVWVCSCFCFLVNCFLVYVFVWLCVRNLITIFLSWKCLFLFHFD